MAVDDHSPLSTTKYSTGHSVPDLADQTDLVSDEASAAFDDTAYRDNIDFDFEDSATEDEISIWQDRATREAFLQAKDDYERFELALKADKRRRAFETVSDPYPLMGKVVTQEVHQKWFLVLENRLGNDPYLGIEALPSDADPPESMLVSSLSSVPSDTDSRGVAERLELRATFQRVATGYYTMFLRIKQATEEKSTVRFLVRIVVRYTMTRMTDVFYLRFFKGTNDESADWYYLKASGQFEVRAHHEIAQVNVRIIQDEEYYKTQRGKLWIRSLELVPVERMPKYQGHVALQVWSKHDVERAGRNRPSFLDVSQLGASVERIQCTDARNLSLELAISPSGEHIAITHPPKAGDWQVGDTLPTSELGVCFFRNPLAVYGSEIMVTVADGDRVGRRLEVFATIPVSLQNAVGYADFVGELASNTNTPSTKFVFCNGLYLDIFEVLSDELVHCHTISLVSKASGLCRTIACEMTMSSISSNMFIWVEEDGRYCTTWDLTNGSAIGRFEISRRQRMTSTGLTALKFARNQNIVAIAGFDNTITTLDAYSGMEISRRYFKHQIEHMAFPSTQSQILVVMLRREEENEQTVMIFDPLQLDVKGLTQIGPPLSRATVLDIFGPKSWPGLGDVCRPDGHLVHFYTAKTPVSSVNAAKPSAIGAVPDTCQYELRITAPRFRRRAGGGQESCLRQVEIWKKDGSRACVFSFIPEPWEQDTPAYGLILPTGDRFVVHSSWTIQVWSLPCDEEPRCKLVFFWSALGDIRGSRTMVMPDIEAILDNHVQFASMTCREFTSGDGQTRFQANVAFLGQKTIRVPIPNSPVRVDDFKNITEHCIRSIHLLALTHSVVSSEYKDIEAIQLEGSSYEDHTWAIVNFVLDHINHTIAPHQMSPTFFDALQSFSGNDVSVLTHLLQESCPNDISAKFVDSLLESSHCNWIPLRDTTSNPLALAIDRRNTAAVSALLDYCTERAVSRHPAYMRPVEQSIDKLQRYYPDFLRLALQNASYIPARRDDFGKEWVTIASFGRPAFRRPVWPRLNFLRHRFHDPIATFQLPTSRQEDDGNRARTFEKIPPSMPVRLEYEYAWYVVPFPSLIKLGPESQFCKMAGENFFDNPALMSILRYKTWHYGIFYWMARYFFLLVFYSIFVAVVTWQLQSTDEEPGSGLIENFLGANWFTLVVVGLVIGCYLLVLEIVQLRYVGLEYFRSLYNYIDVTSIILTITCFAQTIKVQSQLDETSEVVMEQFGPTSFAILAMYLHVIAETRIFRRVGTIVNIIVQIVQKIWDFFIVFALVVAGFTHAFVYFFHAYRTGPEVPVFPKGVWASFTTTFFFLAGRYDTVSDDFDDALMTDAFSTTREEGEQAWRMQLSEALAEAEMSGQFLYGIVRLLRLSRWLPFLKRALSLRRAQHAPTYIYYAARAQELEAYRHQMGRELEEDED
ncbi:hypothetical protein BGZ73_004577 [Actinomortierella ambigua]|nr:hypothetical protein BGZ73_004577 [Actinomortierella ambigua]